jgi:hypothetical protein
MNLYIVSRGCNYKMRLDGNSFDENKMKKRFKRFSGICFKRFEGFFKIIEIKNGHTILRSAFYSS